MAPLSIVWGAPSPGVSDRRGGARQLPTDIHDPCTCVQALDNPPLQRGDAARYSQLLPLCFGCLWRGIPEHLRPQFRKELIGRGVFGQPHPCRSHATQACPVLGAQRLRATLRSPLRLLEKEVELLFVQHGTTLQNCGRWVSRIDSNSLSKSSCGMEAMSLAVSLPRWSGARPAAGMVLRLVGGDLRG